MTVYLVLTGVGILLLLLSLLSDLDFEIGGFDFSIVGVSSALVLAGISGLVLSSITTLAAIVVLLISLGMLVLGFLAGMKLVKVLVHNDSNSIGYDLVGMTGTLTALTGPKSGEVKIDDPRELESRTAVADEYLERGTKVEVVSVEGAHIKVKELANYEYRSY